MENDKLELEVWKGDMGLPSVDPQCLAVMVSRSRLSKKLRVFLDSWIMDQDSNQPRERSLATLTVDT